MARKKRIKVRSLDETQKPVGDGEVTAEDEELEGADELSEGEGEPEAFEAEEPGDEPEAEIAEEPVSVPRDADFSELDRGETAAAAAPELERQIAEQRENYLRALADLENYKKRALKERSDMLKYQGERVLYDVVEILDDFDRAVEHADAEFEHYREGVELIHKKFVSLISKWGVRGESAAGQPFDPNKHNALSKLHVDDAVPGTVINELKKAYFYKDRLLRPAEVVVADAPPAQAEAEDAGLDTAFTEEAAADAETEPAEEESTENIEDSDDSEPDENGQ